MAEHLVPREWVCVSLAGSHRRRDAPRAPSTPGGGDPNARSAPSDRTLGTSECKTETRDTLARVVDTVLTAHRVTGDPCRAIESEIVMDVNTQMDPGRWLETVNSRMSYQRDDGGRIDGVGAQALGAEPDPIAATGRRSASCRGHRPGVSAVGPPASARGARHTQHMSGQGGDLADAEQRRHRRRYRAVGSKGAGRCRCRVSRRGVTPDCPQPVVTVWIVAVQITVLIAADLIAAVLIVRMLTVTVPAAVRPAD